MAVRNFLFQITSVFIAEIGNRANVFEMVSHECRKKEKLFS